ncbi:MAG: glycosyltransferase family 4 protein [Candidatus Limivicinus sp.]|nr:glycosyltransferase family 4 protein [Clostridiales bacterium]MCI7135708.1 glycosyltransferase family 4 protein [Clostridiales bacterium]MDY6133847.1 glycosyltransferase family 4 protein [Candidatus Limivicinus sp.]
MSKILILTNHSYMLYRFRLELIQALMKSHEVVLSMPFVGHEEDFQALGLRCIETDIDRRGINPATDLRLFHTYLRLLKEEKPDLVITYSIKPNIYGGLACRIAGVPYCANVQGLGTAFQRKGLARFVTVLYKLALGKARTVFFENRENAEEFCRRGILSAEKETVLPGAGINLERYSYVPYPENKAIHFLYLGRIMKEKGMDELFAAMRRLREKFGAGMVLDIVGFFDDEGYKAQVDQLVAEGIAEYHGFQSDPAPYYAAADCVVLPSYHEGMSNVLLEAAATGRPVITSDIPGCREAVEDGKTGLLCKARDCASLYEQMARMAETSPAERQAMGLAAHEKMLQEFDKHLVVEKTMSALFKQTNNRLYVHCPDSP